MVFLTQLSSALNKARAYPAGHPVLVAATETLIRHLFLLLAEKPVLTIAVGRDRLLIEGHETDPRHTVVRELAERLHRHQIAALQLRSGIEARELADLLRAFASDGWRTGAPLGLERQEQLAEQWPHVVVEPLPLDMLELDDQVAQRQARSPGVEFWRGLVQTALLDAESGELPDGAAVAGAIRLRRHDAGYCRAIVEWLIQADDQGGWGGGGMGQEGGVEFARRRVAELLAALDPETLQHLLAVGASPAQRRELVVRSARMLPIPAVLELLRAAAASSGRQVSPPVLQVLAKLAGHSSGGAGPAVPAADEVVRNTVRQLVTTWDPAAEASQPQRQLLELLMGPEAVEPAGGGSEIGTGIGGVAKSGGKASAGALRIARLGVEVGASGRALAYALAVLRDAGDLDTLLDLAERGEQAGRRVEEVWAVLSDPAFLRARILDENADLERVGRVLERVGEAAAEPLLDALEAAQSAPRRKWVLKQLERLVSVVGPTLVERLGGKPWFVVRNLLLLIASLPEPPAGFSALPYLSHENARVRREAFKLLVADPATRATAIVQAARDPDPGVALLALGAAAEDCPAELPGRLLEHLRDTYRDADLRIAAIRLLGRQASPAVRKWLIQRVQRGRRWVPFLRRKLADPSPEMLAALRVLAASYGRDPEAQEVLRRARRSRDAEVRAAAAANQMDP
jgi:hypothetical protein